MTSDLMVEQAGGKIPVKRREIFGWAMYDFANSSYTTVIISVVYSAFFTGHIVPASSEARDSYWAIAIIASTLIALVLSPFVGAICDYSGRKKRYLLYATLTCATSATLLFTVGQGDVWLAIGLIAISNAAFMLGEAFCGSFLTDLATKKNMGAISGLGWGLGYFGGLTSLALVMATISATPEADLPAFIGQNQRAMIFIGIFYLLAAIPTFVLVKDRGRPAPGFEGASLGKLAAVGFKELAASWSLVRKYKILFQFFMAFTVYMAGLEVVIKFIGIYATAELKLAQSDLIKMFLIIQISAALGALAFGWLEARIGAKPTVLATIGWWVVAILSIFFLQDIADASGAEPKSVFFVISLIAGGGIGSIQSSSRTVVGLLSPAARSAQMFGFWGMFMRLAIILGMTFGLVSDAVGRREAMLVVVGFFVVGGIMLAFVPIQKGIDEAAKEADGADLAA